MELKCIECGKPAEVICDGDTLCRECLKEIKTIFWGED